jgi:hypothetical protein
MRKGRVVAAGICAAAVGTLAASPAMAGGAAGTEHFTVVNTSTANTGTPPVAAMGPIHALGKDKQLTNNKDRFSFPKGSVVVVHNATKNSQSSDPGSCLGRFNQAGTYKIISGTGAYAHVKGSGKFTVTGYFIGCGNKTTAASVIIQASGPLSF